MRSVAVHNKILRIEEEYPWFKLLSLNPEDFLKLRIKPVIQNIGLRAERSIKPFVIGRKNWLFANTPRGAKASATIYSIVETAKENRLNPFSYLTYLFEQLPNVDIKDPSNIDSLLPWSAALPDYCRVPDKNYT